MPTPNPSSSYLLLEDGSHIVLEDGSGFILLEGQGAGIEYFGGMPHKYDSKWDRRHAKDYRWLNRYVDAKYVEIERQKLGILPTPRATPERIARINVPETAITLPQIDRQDIITGLIEKAAAEMPKGIDLRQEIERAFRADLQIKQMRLEQAIRDAEDEDDAIALLLLH
jgi:hypothetical protein